MNKPTYDPTKQPLAYNQGFVEAQLEAAAKEGRPGAKEVLAAHLLVCQAYDKIRRERDTADEELSLLRPELEKLRAEADKAKGMVFGSNRDYRKMVSLEFNDERTICIVYADLEDGDSFAIGKAYIDDSFQAVLRPPPFPIEVPLPYMTAAVRMLQERCHELPIGFSNDKLDGQDWSE